MKKRRNPFNTPEERDKDRVLRERLERRIAEIERQTGTPGDRYTLAERVRMIEEESAQRRKTA